MDNRKSNNLSFQIVGRFWKGQGGRDYFGYIDLGILGKVKNCRLYASPKRDGRENTDCDFTISVITENTPLGMLSFLRDNLQDALFEPEGVQEPSSSLEAPVGPTGEPESLGIDSLPSGTETDDDDPT